MTKRVILGALLVVMAALSLDDLVGMAQGTTAAAHARQIQLMARFDF